MKLTTETLKRMIREELNNVTKLIKILVLTTNQILISQIDEVGADIGEPDCKLVDPYVVTKEGMLGSVMAGLSPLGMEVAKTASQIMGDPDIERPELESMLKGMFAKELASGELSEDEMMEAIERAYSL